MPITEDMIIPEMQAIKQKYPVYKDVPDLGLLNQIVTKFPVYKPIADRVAGDIIKQRRDTEIGSITEGQPTIGNRIARLNESLGFGDLYSQSEPNQTVGAIKDLSRGIAEEGLRTVTLDRPFGMTKALVAGGDPIEGFKNPDVQQSFGESAVKAWGLDLNNPYHLGAAALIEGLAGYGTAHLLFGGMSNVKGVYTGMQTKELNGLKDTLTEELVKSGIDKGNAVSMVNSFVNAQVETNGFFRNTPGAIKQTNDILKSQPGKLSEFINGFKTTAETNAKNSGFSTDAAKRLVAGENARLGITNESNPILGLPDKRNIIYAQPPVDPLKLPFTDKNIQTPIILKSGEQINLPYPLSTTAPAIQFGQMIKDQMIQRDEIPLHPASEGRMAVANLTAFQRDLKVTPPPDITTTTTTDFGRQIQERILAKGKIPLHPVEEGKKALNDIVNPTVSSKSEFTPITLDDLHLSGEKIPTEKLGNAQLLINGLNNAQKDLGLSLKRSIEYVKKGQQPFNSVYRSQAKQDELRKTIATATKKSIHTDVGAIDIPTFSLKLDQVKVAKALNRAGFDVEDLSLTPKHVHAEIPTKGSETKLMKFDEPRGTLKPPTGGKSRVTRNSKGQSVIKGVTAEISPKNKPTIGKQPLPSKKSEQLTFEEISIPPVKPEEVIASPSVADEVLQRSGNQSPEVIKLAKQKQMIPTPEIIKLDPTLPKPTSVKKLTKQSTEQILKDANVKSLPEYLEKYSEKSFYDITYKDATGVHSTIANGPKLKLLESKGQVLKFEKWNNDC